MNGFKALVLAYDEAKCDCGETVKGRMTGRPPKILRVFTCDGRHGCGHAWDMEVPDAMAATDRPNGNGRNGHSKTVCPHCHHEFEAKA